MRILMVLVLCLSCACSWQGVISEAQAQLGDWRLADNFTPSRSLRWRLPQDARLVVVPPERAQGPRHQPWIAAAQSGLDRIFVAPPALAEFSDSRESTFFLAVEWPSSDLSEGGRGRELENGIRRRHEASLFGMHVWPRLPRVGHINVVLLSPAGAPMHQATLELSPKLWGRDWHDEQMLEMAFYDLAENLRGG